MKTSKYQFLLLLWLLSILALSFVTNRANFPSLITLYSISFISYWKLYTSVSSSKNQINILFFASILVRLIVVFAFPFFSDDIYRFWWDGKLLTSTINPFNNTPRFYIDSQFFTDEYAKFIFGKLNSPDYFSVYPPVCQAIFALAYWFCPTSIYGAAILIKLFLFLCEIGTIFILYRLVKEKSLIYALNPLIIIELCGNAHFEAAMLFFFAITIFLLKTKTASNSYKSAESKSFLSFFFDNFFVNASWKNVFWAGFFLALSVSSKLLTLFFLPFFVKNLGLKKGVLFSLSTLFFIGLLFSPFVNATFFEHFNSSLQLYFKNFEFNASIYYILKAIGNAYFGYTPTEWIAKLISLSTLALLTYFLLKKGEFYQQIFLFFLFYLLFQRAIHPWYLSTLIFLSCFTQSKIGVLWSGLIITSYVHYWNNAYQENYILIIIQYLSLVIFYFFIESKK